MRVTLVGSDCEENLGLSMIAASLIGAGHQVSVVPFNECGELDDVVDRCLRTRPRVVGLGMQFQHRSSDFLRLARQLRQSGYRGHITCGGQYPSMAWAEVLDNDPAVDSIVLHEGEQSIVELCAALNGRGTLGSVSGLAIRSPNGQPLRTAPRALCADLDQLPFAHRYRTPARHLGLAFRPIWGSRGCWGSCAFCAITTYYRDAHSYGGGRKLRLRSTDSLAAEMAALWHTEGDTTLFCFHDETLLLPRPHDSLARLSELKSKLDALGVGQVGLIGKCRPDCVTPELAKELRRLGVVRMFVGVENGSQTGLDHLGRRTTLEQIERALSAYQEAGIFVCYNLLIFEPDVTLDHLRENIDFIRRHAHIPVNFCRAEPYHGTPLHERVKERGTLLGSYLGWDYRIHDDRAELAFRIAAAVCRERNFDAEGVANRVMGLGYTAQLLRSFFNVSTTRGQQLLDRVAKVTRDVVLDTADFLESVVQIAETCDLSDHDGITRETALLGLRVSAHNRVSHAVLDDLITDLCAYVDEQPRSARAPSIPERAKAIIERMTLAGCFAASLQACGGSTDDSNSPGSGTGGVAGTGVTVGGNKATGGGMVYDCVPPSGGRSSYASGGFIASDGGFPPTGGNRPTGGRVSTGGIHNDIVGGSLGVGGGGTRATGGFAAGGFVSDLGGLPPTGGTRATGGFAAGGFVVDAVPGTGGRGTGGRTSATGGLGSGGFIADPLPASGGATSTGGTRATGGLGMGGFIVDMAPSVGGQAASAALPADIDDSARACIVDPAPPHASANSSSHVGAVVENWRNSGPRRLLRSGDLALFDPPTVRVQGKLEAGQVQVQLLSDDGNVSLRWQSEGSVQGEGPCVTWSPASIDDALCVVARGAGGIAVATLRARDVPGYG